jgi:hypothetical protein
LQIQEPEVAEATSGFLFLSAQYPRRDNHQTANMMAMLASDIHRTLEMKQTAVMANPPRQGIISRCFQP